MSTRNYEAAHEHLVAARDLDPAASDNHLNLGAVLLLMGRLEEASASFTRHLEQEQGDGEAYYLVATNYAMAGYSALALGHLAQAITADEKIRLRVRSDVNFEEIARGAAFRELIERDSFVPAPGSLRARREFSVPYATTETSLLNATIDALEELRVPFDRRVEVTPGWALIWADIRVKVTRDPASGRGVVEATAPPATFSPQTWRTRTDELFATIDRALLTYRRKKAP
jgi:tetratricopeptide (TPR) repeat protein